MKVSAIIPVFNADKYLQRAIDSVKKQTYKEWELILVDDGSVDKSLEICTSNASDDFRIKVVHQNNRGPGEARNNGIKAVTGDYIVFIDADDYLDLDYFQLLSNKVAGNDVVFIDVQQIREDGTLGRKEFMSKYKNHSLDDIIRGSMTGFIPWGGVRKVVATKLIKDNCIQYGQSRIGEEAIFTFKVLTLANSFGFIDEKSVYYYVQHPGSQSTILLEDPWGDTFVQLRDYLKNSGLYTEYANTLNSLNVMATVLSINNISRKYSYIQALTLSKSRAAHYLNDIDSNFEIDTEHLPVKASMWIPLLKRTCVFPIVIASKIRNYIK